MSYNLPISHSHGRVRIAEASRRRAFRMLIFKEPILKVRIIKTPTFRKGGDSDLVSKSPKKPYNPFGDLVSAGHLPSAPVLPRSITAPFYVMG
jgi:hypothetical protein